MDNQDPKKYQIKKGILSNGKGQVAFLYVSPKGAIKFVSEKTRAQRRKR